MTRTFDQSALKQQMQSRIDHLRAVLKAAEFWKDKHDDLAIENGRLCAHIRRQAEDIMILGQMVGQCCPLCQKSE